MEQFRMRNHHAQVSPDCMEEAWWEAKQRIATLERERDEDRRRAHDLLNENLELRGQLAALKALCGEAADEVVKVPGLTGLWKRLRAARGE